MNVTKDSENLGDRHFTLISFGNPQTSLCQIIPSRIDERRERNKARQAALDVLGFLGRGGRSCLPADKGPIPSKRQRLKP